MSTQTTGPHSQSAKVVAYRGIVTATRREKGDVINKWGKELAVKEENSEDHFTAGQYNVYRIDSGDKAFFTSLQPYLQEAFLEASKPGCFHPNELLRYSWNDTLKIIGIAEASRILGWYILISSHRCSVKY